MPSQNYASCQVTLEANPKTWLVTGVAGSIGSDLLETLLELVQTVVGLYNFDTVIPLAFSQDGSEFHLNRAAHDLKPSPGHT